jgi:acetoin utilization deacetylase AcuC-like enzyme/nucleotide-binding universal stress UspA family protein
MPLQPSTLNTIVCCVDLSPATRWVTSWAAKLAGCTNARLVVFHAVHMPSDALYPTTEFERGGDLERRRRESLADISECMAGIDASWQAELVYGEPVEALLAFCRRASPDLVIAGSHGLKGFKRLMLGNVVERMARLLVCPLMVVRRAIDAGSPLDHIGVCCDLHHSDEPLVRWGLKLAGALNARLALLHAMESPIDPHMADPTQGPYGDVQNLLQSRLEARLRTLVASDGNESNGVRETVAVHLVPGSAKDAFFKLSREIPLDLIIVGVRQRSTIGKIIVGSTTEALLRNAPAAVLTIPLTEVGQVPEALSRQRPAHTAVVRDVRYLAHTSGGSHMENERRLTEIYSMLDHWLDHPNDGPPPSVLAPRAATLSELSLVHDPDYVRQIAATADSDLTMLTGDTYACARSYEAAALAAGGVIAAIDAVMRDEYKNAFVLCRPPGHHAEISRANGFCLFNNVAIGAQYARVVQGLAKVLIVDWDVHHGNGIQHMFEQDPTVMYMSIHQYPFFPGTGYYLETGKGRGEGYTVNIPAGKGFGDGEYLYLFQEVLAPVARAFRPDLILVAAGFDAHRKDPMSRMKLTHAGFAGMTRILMEIAETCCQGRLVLVLEGGYHPTVLTHSVRAVLTELCDYTRSDPYRLAVRAKQRRVMPVLNRCRHVLAPHWPCLQSQTPSRRDHE